MPLYRGGDFACAFFRFLDPWLRYQAYFAGGPVGKDKLMQRDAKRILIVDDDEAIGQPKITDDHLKRDTRVRPTRRPCQTRTH